VNAIKWNTLNDPVVMDTCNYYRGLLAFRKAHPSLRLATRDQVLETVTPIYLDNPHAVAFGIRGSNDTPMIAIFNSSIHSQPISLPTGKWGVCIRSDRAGIDPITIVEGTVSAEAISALVLVKLS
jgi:pullulanase